MGKLTTRYLVEKGVNISGAYNRSSNLGEDLGTVAGLKQALNVPITSAKQAIPGDDVDIAVVTAVGDMESLYEIAERCLRNGINVVNIAEDTFYPRPFDPEWTDKIDKLAKENNATIVSTGVQDIFWLNIPIILTGACHTIESVHFEGGANVDVFGPVVLRKFPIGYTPEQFETGWRPKPNEGKIPTSGISMEALIAAMGLTVETRGWHYDPVYSDVRIKSNSLDRFIEPGMVTGALEVYEAQTKEGIYFRSEFAEVVMEEGKTDYSNWHIKGEPDVALSCDPFMGGEITCTTTVNRIPDVINAPPGLLIASELPRIQFRPLPLPNYVN